MSKKVQVASRVATDAECFVSAALATVLRVSRYLGTASLRFSRKYDGWIIGLSSQLSVLSSFIITVTGILSLATTFNDFYALEGERKQWNDTQRAMRFSEPFLIATMAMWMVYSAPTHMKDLIRCLNHIHKIHFELKIKHWPKQQKKHIALVILWMTLCVIINFSDYFAISVFMNQSPLWIQAGEFLYCIHYYVIQSCVLQFVLMVMHLKSCFIAINQRLRRLLKDVENKNKQDCLQGSNHIYNPKEECTRRVNHYTEFFHGNKIKVPDSKMKAGYSTTLHTLSCAYGATCCAMRAVDRAHGTMLMLMLAFLFQHLMSAPYFLITNIVLNEYTLDEWFYVFYGLVLLAWTFLHLFNLLLIIEPCHLTHTEMQTCRELLSLLMQCATSLHDPLLVDLEPFYRNVTTNEIYYKPLNVVTMCRGLVIKILGSVATYLVILITIE